ncbi:MotE family protein [Virgibacillus flavescens]|uniref:MotE family protein n=1 Tax=Virgibacillus flavescens TaxID=1611422 RepID=UPI003D336E5C
MAKNKKDQTKTKSNPILWFLFAIVVPVIVAVTVIIIIFKVAGFDVIDWAKEKGDTIPVISSMVKTDVEKSNIETEEEYKSKLKKKDNKIEELDAQLTSMEETIDQLEQEIVKLENKDSPEPVDESSTEDENKKNEKPSQLISMTASFEQMDTAQSALILQDLEEGMAIAILKGVPEDVRAGILEEMETEKAAQYTKAYLNSGE